MILYQKDCTIPRSNNNSHKTIPSLMLPIENLRYKSTEKRDIYPEHSQSCRDKSIYKPGIIHFTFLPGIPVKTTNYINNIQFLVNMKIHLPNSAFLGNIDSFLKSIDPENKNNLEITANDRWISIHPAVLCMTAAMGIRAKNITCQKLEAKSRHYLERMGLFRLLEIESGMDINKHDPSGRFIPLMTISDSSSLTRFITDMIPLLHLKPEQAEPIRYIMSELIRNVLEHAEADAIVCAQYYKKSNTLRLGIADSGVGIKHTISRTHEVPDDLEAIRLALTPGITGTTTREGGTELNAGAGLFFIKSIALANKSFFMIYSGNAMYKLLKPRKLKLHTDPFRDRHSKDDDYPIWQGTVVGIDISLDSTEHFTELLDMIRDTYVQSVKERKKQRKRPRFI